MRRMTRPLTHWCLGPAVTGGWRAGDSLDLALERGVHGGGGQAVAQGGPVHAPHAGQVVGGVGAHTSRQGGAQARTWRQERCVMSDYNVMRDYNTLSGLTHVARSRHSLEMLLVLLRG